MTLSSKFKFLAVMAAVFGLAVFISAPMAKADPGNGQGQGQQNVNPNGNNGNGNNGSPPGANNGHSQRDAHCKGRGCNDTTTITDVTAVDEVAGDDNEEINCLDPQFSSDPRCVAPVKKKAKRKVLSVKLSNTDNIVPAVVEAAPAPVAIAEPAPAAPAPAPVAKVKASAGSAQNYNLGTTNFQ